MTLASLATFEEEPDAMAACFPAALYFIIFFFSRFCEFPPPPVYGTKAVVDIPKVVFSAQVDARSVVTASKLLLYYGMFVLS